LQGKRIQLEMEWKKRKGSPKTERRNGKKVKKESKKRNEKWRKEKRNPKKGTRKRRREKERARKSRKKSERFPGNSLKGLRGLFLRAGKKRDWKRSRKRICPNRTGRLQVRAELKRKEREKEGEEGRQGK